MSADRIGRDVRIIFICHESSQNDLLSLHRFLFSLLSLYFLSCSISLFLLSLWTWQSPREKYNILEDIVSTRLMLYFQLHVNWIFFNHFKPEKSLMHVSLVNWKRRYVWKISTAPLAVGVFKGEIRPSMIKQCNNCKGVNLYLRCMYVPKMKDVWFSFVAAW